MTRAEEMRSLLQGDALVGAAADLDGARAERIGRALGTLARRRGLLRTSFLLAADEAEGVRFVREGLLCGLLLSGHDVSDVGPLDAEGLALAMEQLAHPGGVLVEERAEGAIAISLLLDGRTLVRRDLEELCDIAEMGDFAAGEGALRKVDATRLLHKARRDRASTTALAEPSP